MVPQFHLFCIQVVPAKLVEEIRTWTGVHLYSVPVYLDLPLLPDQRMVDLGGFEKVRALLMHRLLQSGETHGHLIWVKLGWSFEPVGNSLAEAEKTQDPHRIEATLAKGRDIVMSAMQMVIRHGSLRSMSGNVTVMEGWSQDHPARAHLTNQVACHLGTPDCQKGMQSYPLNGPVKPNADFGMWPLAPKSTAQCFVDVREDSVINQALVGHLDQTTPKEHIALRFKNPDIKKLALALPTTSKGMREGEDPVFLTALLPSLIQTLSEAEWYRFNIVIYVGFDHGDMLFDDLERRRFVKEKATRMIGERPIIIKFLRLPNTHRVAMLWSMMFVKAMSEGADYFYQVNDDVTMVTPGWLTRFTSALDANGGFGVVGPFDTHNQLNCTVLTQAMVTRQHYDIFTLFYPTDLRDWKTDRWLTNVYGPENTFCWEAIKVRNGASPTRYQFCEFLSWRIYLEAGRRRIAKWLETHQVNRNPALLAALPPKTPPTTSF